MPEIIRSPEVYDAVIVGSGAGGGMAAYVLTKAGAKCLMLEAGDWWDTAKQSTMMQWPYEAPYRGAPTPQKPNGYFDPGYAGWQLAGEPYTIAPGSTWRWWRSRMLGGRTNHWGRISLRMGPYDFKPYSRDGKGFDWPISYDDVAPYYDKTEELIGVFGTAEGLENTPDGKFLPPPVPRCYELLVQNACRKLSIPCIPSRLSILTRPLNGRPECHYCGQCGRSCATSSNFSSPTVLIPPAMATGKLKIICNAMGREVIVGKDGLATGVSYIDKKSRKEVQVRGKIVVLAASTCETARILLNSKSSALFPNGLGNSSGMVGKYLMDTVGVDGSSGFVPAMVSLPPHNEDGVGGMHLYMPWWNYQKQARHEMPFSRGFHIEFGGGHHMPGGWGFGEGSVVHGYGRELKTRARQVYGAFIGFSARGEMIPNENSYCEIDNNVVDEWGIPVLRFHFKWSEDEIQMAKYARETFDEIIRAAGGEPQGHYSAKDNWALTDPGAVIHEVGACRMGSDPKTSALNSNCQAWDCKNLFITDGAPFVSNADKNPTLSIMALAWRTSEYAADQVKKLSV